jgi:hypothetical protein
MFAKEKAGVGDRLLEHWITNVHGFVGYVLDIGVFY